MNPLKDQVLDDEMERLFTAFQLLRTLDREVPGQLVSAYFFIACRRQCHKQALEQGVGFACSSGSRNSDWLTKHHRLKNGRGLQLITKERDPSDRRRCLLTLSAEGSALADQMKSILWPER